MTADSETDRRGSISKELQGLKENDPDAIHQLWERCFQQLVRAARRKLGDFPRGLQDSEDIALGVFASLCRGVALGRYPQLENRQDLWRILLKLTRDKAVDHIRRELAEKHGGGRVQSMQRDYAGDELSPGDLVLLDDQFQHLLSRLPDETCRKVARLKIELRNTEEIAELLDVAPRTIDRKLKLIQQIWTNEFKETET